MQLLKERLRFGKATFLQLKHRDSSANVRIVNVFEENATVSEEAVFFSLHWYNSVSQTSQRGMN